MTTKMPLFMFILVAALSFKAHGLCNFPCALQGQTWFFDKGSLTRDLDFISSSVAQFTEMTPNGTESRISECVVRDGPYIITRRPEGESYKYRCLKIVYLDNDVFIWRLSRTDDTGTIPDLCSICSEIDDTSNVQVFVDVGCNIPKTCPSESYDSPCTGCEEGVPDDGSCC